MLKYYGQFRCKFNKKLTGIEAIRISATFDSAKFTKFALLVSFAKGIQRKLRTETDLGE